MQNNKKWALGISVLAMVEAGLWMRELASRRPFTVARLDMNPANDGMVLSRDGRRILIQGVNKSSNFMNFRIIKVVLSLDSAGESAGVGSKPQQVRDFWKRNASGPVLALNPGQTQLIFSPAPGKKLLLAGKINPQDFDFDARGEGASHFAWSKGRGEIYRENNGEVRIWDSQTGRLKNRHSHWKDGSYQNGSFSPDGQSLLSFHRSPQGLISLLRYDVPTGKLTHVMYRTRMASLIWHQANFGWSPDGKFFWFVRRDPKDHCLDFNVVRTSDSKSLWSAPCAGDSRWLRDGRIGLIQKDGFSWRDASGREIGHLSGPLPKTDEQWDATPDGKWIYSSDGDGIIYRWRAR